MEFSSPFQLEMYFKIINVYFLKAAFFLPQRVDIIFPYNKHKVTVIEVNWPTKYCTKTVTEARLEFRIIGADCWFWLVLCVHNRNVLFC